jgi:PIN domain nuclease of toxin-antitoxin system
MIALDTHVVAWLHAGQVERIPQPVRARLETEALVISPIVVMELEFLRELNRLSLGGEEIFRDLAADLGVQLCQQPLVAVMREAIRQNWTRDPFDRIIAAQALAAGCDLVTKDEVMLRHCPAAFWRAGRE